MTLDKAGNIIDSLGTAGAKTGNAFWVIIALVMVVMMALWLLWTNITYSSTRYDTALGTLREIMTGQTAQLRDRSDRAVDVLVKELHSKNDQISHLITIFVENAPTKKDQETRDLMLKQISMLLERMERLETELRKQRTK